MGRNNLIPIYQANLEFMSVLMKHLELVLFCLFVCFGFSRQGFPAVLAGSYVSPRSCLVSIAAVLCVSSITQGSVCIFLVTNNGEGFVVAFFVFLVGLFVCLSPGCPRVTL